MGKMMNKPTFNEELMLWNSGFRTVIGVDEVGRGAFAGPIVAAGVIFKPNFKNKFLHEVNDSKLLTPKKREKLSKIIKENSIWEIQAIDVDYINKNGIGKANSAVFRKVLKGLILKIEQNPNYFILIDGFHKKYLPGGIKKQKAIIKGDQKSLSIASASIIAKVYRDNLMKKMDANYPNYLFSVNKGYGTKKHQEALSKFGLSKIHRTSFNLYKFATI